MNDGGHHQEASAYFIDWILNESGRHYKKAARKLLNLKCISTGDAYISFFFLLTYIAYGHMYS